MVYAKKKFGQNFLKSEKALDAIIAASGVGPNTTVLEIGPGRGALTKKLLETGVTVRALEVDPEMVAVLRGDFSDEIDSGQLQIIEGDIQQIPPRALMANNDGSEQYSVVANIPYYITGLIIRTFLESDCAPQSMTLLVQKEVAIRIVDGHADGKRGKENILSLSVKVFGDVRYVATVPASAFDPAPKVDSAVIHISNISHSKLHDAGITAADFFETVKAGFAQKRKTLRNNLSQRGNEAKLVEEILDSMNIDARVRAEDLTLDQWLVFIKGLLDSRVKR